MTGSELRQYLHISTRKLKYLMDHNYIPHEDTGQSTYKYRVLVKDARTFKRRMKCEPGFLSELSGLFTSTRPAGSPAPNRARERIDSAEFENTCSCAGPIFRMRSRHCRRRGSSASVPKGCMSRCGQGCSTA